MEIFKIDLLEMNSDKTAFTATAMIDGELSSMHVVKPSNYLCYWNDKGSKIMTITDSGDANWSSIMRVFEGA